MTEDILSILNNKTIWFTDEYASKFPEGTKEREVLDIFSYGTWDDYLAIKDSLPDKLKFTSSSPAARKLKALTILTIMETENSIAIEELMKKLNIDNIIDTENIIIDLFGSKLLDGKIDEKTRTLNCIRVSARCVKNEAASIDAIISDINNIRGKIAGIKDL